MYHHWRRQLSRLMLGVTTGAFLLQLGSCNPSMRDAVLIGLETTSLTFANTLIAALFAGFGE